MGHIHPVVSLLFRVIVGIAILQRQLAEQAVYLLDQGTIREIGQAVSEYSSALAHAGDAHDSTYDMREEYDNYDFDSVMEKYGNNLENDILDGISGFMEMHTVILLVAEILTVITILIIIGILSSKEKKR